MYEIKEVLLEKEIQLQKQILTDQHLNYEQDIDYSILVYDGKNPIATASLSKNIMKCFAINKEYSGQNITGLMFKHLKDVLQSRNIYHFFVYTGPKNKKVFESLNMKKIVETMNTVLFESGDTIENVLTNLKQDYNISDNKKACVIINANPMTLGHLYLIEEASKENEEVLVFVVSEDLSSFPFEDRFSIIKNATKGLKNVTVLPTSAYLVSKITFPKYFLKEDYLIKDEQTLIDVLIYKEYYTKIFNIHLRYVGSEPLSYTTNKYNETMKTYLNKNLKIIERKQKDDLPISASMVRKLIKTNKIDKIKDYVPKATYDYLKSDKGQSIIIEIQSKDLTRH